MRRIALAIAALLAGCVSKSPYDYMENWILREEVIRPFAVPADVIYVQDRLYDGIDALQLMTAHAMSEVGGKRFKGVARVFSPLISDADDLEKAIEWYLDHRGGKRPFFFIGEGFGGTLLRAYETYHFDSLKDDGFVAGYYTGGDASGKFVTDKLVTEIRNTIFRIRYRSQWGREMPGK